MKRFLFAITAVVYLFVALGVNLHLHYCMGKLAGWGFWPEDHRICSTCGMKKQVTSANNCCTDTYAPVKLSIDQKIPHTSFSVFSPALRTTEPRYDEHPVLSMLRVLPAYADGPPRSSPRAVYLQNRNFRI